MVTYDEEEDQVWVTIPLTGIHELSDYQIGVLEMLKKIENEDLDDPPREALNYFRRFLNHLLTAEGFFARNKALLLENPLPVRLPAKVELAISLIKAELKNLRFINDILQQGIDASSRLWDFGELILGLTGLDTDPTDGLNEWYFARQTQLIKSIEAGDEEGFSAAAFDFYIDLVMKQREGEAG